MHRYWIKRIFWTLPVLVLISVFTFMLSKLAPGDPVLMYMNLGNERRIISGLDRETYEKLYLATVEKYHLDLPTFYFSLVPWCMHKDLWAGLNYAQKKQAEYLVYEYGHSAKVLEFLHAKEAFLISHLTRPDLSLEDRSVAMALDTAVASQPIEMALTRLMDSYQVDEPSFQRLKSSWIDLKAFDPPWYYYMPRLLWHGTHNQYHKWITNLVMGNWGVSSIDGRPVLNKIWNALQWSIPFNILSWIGIIGLSLWIGVLSAINSHTIWIKILEVTLLIINATPLFWLASIAVIYLTGSQIWQIFPSPGSIDHLYNKGSFSQMLATLFFISLPLICIILSSLAFLSRQVKQLLLHELSKPYIQAAVLRGLPQKKILRTYALPNALIPLTAYVGRFIPALISGSVVIETIFNIPGIGKLIVEATLARDWNVAFLIFLLGTILTVLGIMLSDYLLAILAPRSMQSLIRSK